MFFEKNYGYILQVFVKCSFDSENIYFLVGENPHTEPSSRVLTGNDATVLAIYQAAFS